MSADNEQLLQTVNISDVRYVKEVLSFLQQQKKKAKGDEIKRKNKIRKVGYKNRTGSVFKGGELK